MRDTLDKQRKVHHLSYLLFARKAWKRRTVVTKCIVSMNEIIRDQPHHLPKWLSFQLEFCVKKVWVLEKIWLEFKIYVSQRSSTQWWQDNRHLVTFCLKMNFASLSISRKELQGKRAKNFREPNDHETQHRLQSSMGITSSNNDGFCETRENTESTTRVWWRQCFLQK